MTTLSIIPILCGVLLYYILKGLAALILAVLREGA